MPTGFIESLAARRRFGMRPGLDAIRALCAALGDPQKQFRAIHVAGTNGKGAVCALLSAALTCGNGGIKIGRYTSPHLVKLNERFCVNDQPLPDDKLEEYAKIVENALRHWGLSPEEEKGQTPEVTFFEALTAVGFLAFANAKVDVAILECGLGGRLDATNVC